MINGFCAFHDQQSVSCGLEKNASRVSAIRQQTHRRCAAGECRHCFFCRALDTPARHHHHR
jgi:hypothetical protein